MTAAQEFEKNLLSSFTDKLSSLSPVDKLKYAGDRISKAIEYASRRHDWYEDQRGKMFQGAVTISSAIFIVAGWIAKDFSNHGVPIALLGFLSIALIGLVFAVYYYNSELDSNRSYRLVSDIRIWYFKYNLPGSSSASSNGRSAVELANAVINERKIFSSTSVKL